MSLSRLTPLQVLVLGVLAGQPTGWTLTGRAALAGFHTRHRMTRDLDLFWHGKSELGSIPREVDMRLRASGLTVATSTTSPHFTRFLVNQGSEQLVVDLVADPVPFIEQPAAMELAGHSILVDTVHEILVDKLLALVGRTELRDLVDVGCLLEHGGDLTRGLAEAPRKDSGFSPLTLAWLLHDMAVERMALAEGRPAEEVARLLALRRDLGERISRLADPRP